MSSSLTFCSIVLLVSMTDSMIQRAESSRLASSISPYTQLMSLSFLIASLSAQISMRLCQTTLLVLDFELTMMYSSGFGSPVTAPSTLLFTSSNVFTVGRTLSTCKPSASCGLGLSPCTFLVWKQPETPSLLDFPVLLELAQLPAHSEHTWTAVCPGSEWAGSSWWESWGGKTHNADSHCTSNKCPPSQ